MGVVDRLIKCLPSHPHPPKLKKVPKVLPQVTSVLVHLPSLQASDGPTGLYNDCKRSKTDGPDKGIRLHQYWLIRAQSHEEAQVNTQTVVDMTQSLGWIINQEKSKLKPTQVFSFVGYEYHLDSALVKPTQERWLKLQDSRTQVKTCFDCKMFDVANWVACLNEENGPGGTPSHEALSVSPQGALEISSGIGQPPSLDRNHFSTPRVVAECLKRDERCRPSSQRPQYPTLYRCLKRRLGRSLRASLYKGSVDRQEKRLHINILELKAVSLALQRFKDQCQN